MKRILAMLLAVLMLAGCGATESAEVASSAPEASAVSEAAPEAAPEAEPEASAEASVVEEPAAPEYTGTVIELSDEEILVDGTAAGTDPAAVYLSNDIVYYEDKDTYESGNPYGEGTEEEKHSAEEAAAHTVVNITEPGDYKLTGTLSQGQILIDLGEDAYENPEAVVNLTLDNADVTCTVAPVLVFRNVYECDGEWSTETAKPDVDTSAAGANLILAEGSVNNMTGSHVARIYKDNEEEKKLWKEDGAVYSYMSMNVGGTGTLNINADNEGLDSELHLTINDGYLNIYAGNDGINTNEDFVSVTTINGGHVHIIAGLGEEGDGIDSNGYLVINGGTVVASANPRSDAGLDSDLGSFVNGGYVIALGSTMDWAESESEQITMNLQMGQYQDSGCAVVITKEDGTVIFAYDPSEDEVLADNARHFQGAVVSAPGLEMETIYYVYFDGTVTGEDLGGMYDPATVTAYEGGIQQMYTGTDVQGFPGFPGGPGGPGGFPGGPGGFPGMPGEEAEEEEEETDIVEMSGYQFYTQDPVNDFSGVTEYTE